jgi:hypothetical protein
MLAAGIDLQALSRSGIVLVHDGRSSGSPVWVAMTFWIHPVVGHLTEE